MKVRAMSYPITLLFIATGTLHPQDSRYRPERQQIPTPNCLEIAAAWEGGQMVCAPNEPKVWLTDITHWRNERRIRIGYSGARYHLAALKWTQSSFILANDGGRSLLVRSRMVFKSVPLDRVQNGAS